MQKYLRILSIIVTAEFLLPIVFKNLPFPLYSHIFWQTIWFGSLILFRTKVLIKSPLIYIYIGVAYFALVNLLDKSSDVDLLYNFNLLDMLFALSMYYFFTLTNDLKGFSLLLKFILIFIVISSITSIIGFIIFPESIRFNPASGAETPQASMELSKYYNSIGILGYGFFYGIAVIMPMLNLFYKNLMKSTDTSKILFILFALILLYALIKAGYATSFLLALTGLFLSFLGLKIFNKYRSLIVVVVFALFLFSENIIGGGLIDLSTYLEDGSILQNRINDLGLTFIGEEGTHVSGRLERIPVLLSNWLEKPLFGNKFSTGHNFILDVLSFYGIVGLIPFILIIYSYINHVRKFLIIEHRYYFNLVIFLFVVYSVFKGVPDSTVYFFIILIAPGISVTIQYEGYYKYLGRLKEQTHYAI